MTPADGASHQKLDRMNDVAARVISMIDGLQADLQSTGALDTVHIAREKLAEIRRRLEPFN